MSVRVLNVPYTDDMAPCTLVGRSGVTETAYEDALKQYNVLRADFGLDPVCRFPWGVSSTLIEQDNS